MSLPGVNLKVFKILRMLRVLRPLRVISRNEGLKVTPYLIDSIIDFDLSTSHGYS